jgi:hypothetical protein
MSSDSASTPSKLMFVVLGTRGEGAPLSVAPLMVLRMPCSRRSRSAATSAVDDNLPLASRAATPMPAIPGTFSVPPRRFRSCFPPVIVDTSRVPRRIHSAPAPLGPLNLCADSASRSTPSARTSTGILPIDCTASV